MSANHTPGPWAAIEIKGDPLRSFAIDAGVYLGSLAVWPVHSDEMQANAQLIAAAPDLLAALESVLLDANVELPAERAALIQSVINQAKGI